MEVRVTVGVSGKVLRSEWEALEHDDPRASAAPDVVRDDLVAGISLDVEAGRILSVPFEGGRRFVAGRHVEWVDVEVRHR